MNDAYRIAEECMSLIRKMAADPHEDGNGKAAHAVEGAPSF